MRLTTICLFISLMFLTACDQLSYVKSSKDKPQWQINQEAALEMLVTTLPPDRLSMVCDFKTTKVPDFERTTSFIPLSVIGNEESATHTVKIGLSTYDITLKKKEKGGYCVSAWSKKES